jgi:hypothetical protein
MMVKDHGKKADMLYWLLTCFTSSWNALLAADILLAADVRHFHVAACDSGSQIAALLAADMLY